MTDMTTNSCPICNAREPEFQVLMEALERLAKMELCLYHSESASDWRVWDGKYGVDREYWRGATLIEAINAAWEAREWNRSEE